MNGELQAIHRPAEFTRNQLALIKRQVAKDTTNDEFDYFIQVARQMGLDPFRGQIHCIIYNAKNPEKRQLSIQASINGLRAIAERSGDYSADEDEPLIVYDESLKDDKMNPLGIVKATVKCFKGQPGDWKTITATAYWEEFAPMREMWGEVDGKRQPIGKFELPFTSNWRKMPRLMIAKCAEAQALRKGWPEDIAGLYSTDEMSRAGSDDNASQIVQQYEEDERLKIVKAHNAIAVQWGDGQPLDSIPKGQFYDRIDEWLGKVDSPTQLSSFRAVNQIPFKSFWSHDTEAAMNLRDKMDALQIKLDAEG